MNRFHCIGNFTRDPELKETPNGHKVVEFSLAINSRGKNEEVAFIDFQAWDKQAEIIAQYCKKGKPVYVESTLKQEKWTDKEGNNRSKLKGNVSHFEFLPGNPLKKDDEESPSDKDKGEPVGAVAGGVDEEKVPF